jgi:hypothetical protein
MEKKLTLLLLVVVVLFVNLTNATVRVQICPRESAKDYILGFRDKSALHRPGFVTEVLLRIIDLSTICFLDLSFVIDVFVCL